ncbi:MAG: hypothetical protein P4M11_02410 [Candidatus Pacebacteria bacterium]|nr:hypothetical protein [Candidatus Paceibacterota bacterium]
MFRSLSKLLVPALRSFGVQRSLVRPLAARTFAWKFMAGGDKKSPVSEHIKELKSAEEWEKLAIKASQDTPVVAEFYAKY